MKGNYKKPFIKVVPPDIKVTDTMKKEELFDLAIRNWNFQGMEGLRTSVIICSNGDEVELLINGESYGRRIAGAANNFFTLYEVLYKPGIIEVINYRNKMEFSREIIQS